ncbi:hypothetical protein PVAND_017286 [Polypedilum vanderplanki]|uniref:Peptidase S1 domain-containing protein n=1 Tax=Polypedilum vanderplanki TaxID=319348 RepID=A0A9J6BIL2_POLVA|nr:hypothetical protein PVAND_017286 [Polypedilum vanderplanki]
MKISLLIAIFLLFKFTSALYPIRSDWHKIPPAYEAPELKHLIRKYFGVSELPSKRIVNGDLARIGQFPHQVLKFMQASNGGWFFCGGSIIGAHWVLTAAHCVLHRVNVEIYAGLIDRAATAEYFSGTLSSLAFRIHPEYNEAFLDHDIALIEIISPIPLVGNVRQIPLPRRQDATTSVVGLQATASGFGATFAGGPGSQFLRYWEQPIAPDSVCLSYYAPGWFLPDQNICMDTSSGRAVCQGDSGGAISVEVNGRRGVFGIVSFVAAAGCDRGFPEVYVKVTAYLDWIHWNTQLVEP